MKLLFALAVMSVLALFGWLFSRRNKSGEPTFAMRIDDPDMIAAQEEALRTLPRFWEALELSAPGDDDFMVKVDFSEDGKRPVFIWADAIERDGDNVRVRWRFDDSNPYGFRLGQEFPVIAKRVFDWGFKRDRKVYGMFFDRVIMRKHEDYRPSRLSDSPLPAGWTE